MKNTGEVVRQIRVIVSKNMGEVSDQVWDQAGDQVWDQVRDSFKKTQETP